MDEIKRKVRKLILRAEFSLINNQLSEAKSYNENARELILKNWDEMEYESLAVSDLQSETSETPRYQTGFNS